MFFLINLFLCSIIFASSPYFKINIFITPVSMRGNICIEIVKYDVHRITDTLQNPLESVIIKDTP